jgi:hypothetical protein
VDALDIVAIPLGFAAGSAVRCILLVMVLVPRMRRMPTVVAAREFSLGPSPTPEPSGRR